MPTMPRLAQAFCRSLPWRAFSRRVILPWALHGVRPQGDVVEIGGGSGAMAAGVLETFPHLRITVTDFDESMVSASRWLLARFGDRAVVRQADAAALPFDDVSFDGVLSFAMLHHVGEWEKALEEAIRVLRPGGLLAGYDLLANAPMHRQHSSDDRGHTAGGHGRMMTLPELRARLEQLPVEEIAIRPSLGHFAARFSARKRPIAGG